MLMKWFIISLRCIKMVERAFGGIYEPLMVCNVSFLPASNLKFHEKTVFRYPLNKGNVMLCYNERYPLLVDYFIPFLTYIRIVIRATGSLYEYESLVGTHHVITVNNNHHISCKFEVLSTLSAHEMCYAMLQGEVSPANEVIHNLPRMYKDG